MLFNLSKCERNAHVSPHAPCRMPSNQPKWRKCNFISIQFEMWPFFRPFSAQSLFLYRLPPLCLPSSKLKPLKLKAYFRSFSLSLSLFSGSCKRACNLDAQTHTHPLRSPFRMWIVTNNDDDFIQHVMRIVRISNDHWPDPIHIYFRRPVNLVCIKF